MLDYLILILLLFLSAFFSGSETAFMSLKLHRKNVPNHIKLILEDSKMFLTSVLSANTIVNISIAVLQRKFPNITFVKASDELYDWEQMLLMSCCDHHIIANSSFSWWGAYFNPSKEKIVCYPSVWFGPKLAYMDVKDLFPDSWEKIY